MSQNTSVRKIVKIECNYGFQQNDEGMPTRKINQIGSFAKLKEYVENLTFKLSLYDLSKNSHRSKQIKGGHFKKFKYSIIEVHFPTKITPDFYSLSSYYTIWLLKKP